MDIDTGDLMLLSWQAVSMCLPLLSSSMSYRVVLPTMWFARLREIPSCSAFTSLQGEVRSQEGCLQ